MEKIKIRKYNDGMMAVLKNRRVFVTNLENKELKIQFEILCPKEIANIPCATHTVKKGIITVTTLKITEEAAYSLFYLLNKTLKPKK